MTLTLSLTTEEQAKLEEKARDQGLSLDAFVHGVAQAAAPDIAASGQKKNVLPLPAWPGCATGSLRREDIYEDVRRTDPHRREHFGLRALPGV